MRITNIKYCLKILPGEKTIKTRKIAPYLNGCSIRKEKQVSSFKNAVSVTDKLIWKLCQRVPKCLGGRVSRLSLLQIGGSGLQLSPLARSLCCSVASCSSSCSCSSSFPSHWGFFPKQVNADKVSYPAVGEVKEQTRVHSPHSPPLGTVQFLCVTHLTDVASLAMGNWGARILIVYCKRH